MSSIGTLNEGPLHQRLKERYAEPGDRLEVPLAGRHIDLVRGELLIEIQTQGVSSIRHKLAELARTHEVRLVVPVAAHTWIVRRGAAGEVLGRRRSPKRRGLAHAFAELVSVPRLFAEPGFSCEVLLTDQEEVRRHEPGRARRRKGWVIVERRLLEIGARWLIETPADLLAILPEELPRPFTTQDLAEGLGVRRWLAQKVAYTLREAGALETQGRGRAGWRYSPAA